MAGTNEKQLKAVLFTDNFLDQPANLVKSNCYTVQDYRYHCYRERDEFRNPYGTILSEYLDFSVIVSNVRGTKIFYERLEDPESNYFSFVFNASFNEIGRLTDYEDGLIVKGYVIDIEEKCLNDDENSQEQLLLHVKILFNQLSFLGKETVHNLIFTND